MKTLNKFIFSCILMALFLIQFSSAVAEWYDFGRVPRSTQSQSSGLNSQFGIAQIITSSMPNGLLTNNSNIAYQPLIPAIDVNGNYLILQNGNYLQIYDKNLNLLSEKLIGRSEGQLSTINYIGDFSNIENILGFWRFNNTILSFRAYNYTGNLSLIFESNFSTPLLATTNGVKCFTALGYGECYAFIDEEINSTLYQHSFLKITYNPFNYTADFTQYIITNSSYKIYEPPAWTDWDYDGTLEFLGFSSDRTLVIDYNGNLELNYTAFNRTENAKFMKIDAGNYKVVIVNQENFLVFPSEGFNRIRYRILKTDGTIFWDTIIPSSNSGDVWRNNGLALVDYNGDGYDDLWVLETRTGSNLLAQFRIYDVTQIWNGTNYFYNHNLVAYFTAQSIYPDYSMTLAQMTSDSTFDWVGTRNGQAYLWDTTNNNFTINNSIGAVSCIPADLDYDGLNDMICTSSTGTTKYSANYTNQNAFINSVSFSPSTSIAVNSTLTATISATDPEADTIFYSIRCNDTASFTLDTDGNTKNCIYDTIGEYNVTIRVRDEFHGIYDTLTQPISVSLVTSIETEGGISIPAELVNVEDNQQGLLPSIYYGTLGFFSNILSPLFIIVILFLSLAIIITIIAIAVKLVKKASNIG